MAPSSKAAGRRISSSGTIKASDAVNSKPHLSGVGALRKVIAAGVAG